MLHLRSIACQLILAKAAVATTLRKGNHIDCLAKTREWFEIGADAKSDVSSVCQQLQIPCALCAQKVRKCMSLQKQPP